MCAPVGSLFSSKLGSRIETQELLAAWRSSARFSRFTGWGRKQPGMALAMVLADHDCACREIHLRRLRRKKIRLRDHRLGIGCDSRRPLARTDAGCAEPEL